MPTTLPTHCDLRDCRNDGGDGIRERVDVDTMSTRVPSSEASAGDWVGDVLGFWFSELDEEDWWKKNPAVDDRIRTRFLGLHERLMDSGAIEATQPLPMLAAVIVLDQFSRNMFRGTPRAYAADPIARRLAREAITQGFDESMRAEQRMFLYLPF